MAGGAGYVGAHTAIELMDQGYSVCIADDFSGGTEGNIARMNRILRVPVEWARVNLTDYRQTAAFFEKNRFDAVMNFAAYKAIEASVTDPLIYYENNLNVTINLCKAMAAFDIGQMVFSSSATVYGSGTSPMTEDQSTDNTTNPYGETKRMCEKILSDFHAADSTKQVCVLRYFNPIGAHKSGLIGEPDIDNGANLMSRLCNVAKGQQAMLEIYGNDYPTPDGTAIRDYVHVMDVAGGHVAALKFLNQFGGFHAFNLGTGCGVSVLEIVKTFQTVSGVEIPYRFMPRRSGDVAECIASVDKADRVLHWRTKRTLEEMVRDTWRFACSC